MKREWDMENECPDGTPHWLVPRKRAVDPKTDEQYLVGECERCGTVSLGPLEFDE